MIDANKPTRSDRRDAVFEEGPAQKAQVHVGARKDWLDLYALLEIDEEAPTQEVEEAIVSRGADCLFFSFSKSGRPEVVNLLEAHQNEFRPILLDRNTRRRYNAELRRHRQGDPSAPPYGEFLRTVTFPSASGCLSALLFFWLP